jgi:hypothetical protein
MRTLVDREPGVLEHYQTQWAYPPSDWVRGDVVDYAKDDEEYDYDYDGGDSDEESESGDDDEDDGDVYYPVRNVFFCRIGI